MSSCVASYKSRCSRFFVNLQSRGTNGHTCYYLHRLIYSNGEKQKYRLSIDEFKAIKDGDDCLMLIKDKRNLLV